MNSLSLCHCHLCCVRCFNGFCSRDRHQARSGGPLQLPAAGVSPPSLVTMPPVSGMAQQPLSARQVLQVGKARLAKLSAQEIRSEQQAWRTTQKQKQLHEQRTRIILDDAGNILQHRSHDQSPDTTELADDTQRQQLRREEEQEQQQSSALLTERYQSMKLGMRDETATLRSILASSPHPATPLPVTEGELLPPTTSPLLGTFSPHLVSHRLPTLFSYPVFHFGRGQPISVEPYSLRHIFTYSVCSPSLLCLVILCTDAFQPHLACCYTLNQAHQLIHRINQQLSSPAASSFPTPSTSPPPTSYLYAYHIGSGIGRLASYADGPHSGAGERLLYQLQSAHTTNLIVLITCHTNSQTVVGGGVGREAEVAGERVRCVVRVAKGMLREWKRCVKELQAEEARTRPRPGEEEKEGGWEQTDSSNPEVNTDAPTTTFITQPLLSEEEIDDTGAYAITDEVSECALPLSPALKPRLTHTARLNHYLHTLSSSLPALVPSPPPRTTPTAVYWTLPSLRADILSILFPTTQPTSTFAFLSSASLLAVRWQLLPCLEQEREWMVSEEVWEGARDWLEKETTAERVRQQWVEGSWSIVRRSVWDVYVRQMKFMNSTYQQADMEAMAAINNPPLILRLLLLAVGGVLGWPQLQWSDVVPYLTGLRAVPPQDIFAEFAPPPGPLQSAPVSPPSSVASTQLLRPALSFGSSPYEHTHVITDPLLSDPSSTPDAVSDPSSNPSIPPAATPLLRYCSYRSDLFAHLLSFDLFTLPSSTLQRVQSVLCEHALAPSELPALDKQAPGSRWLVHWLVLVMRCSRLWQLSRQVLKVQVEEEVEQLSSASRSSTASNQRRNRRTVRVDDVEIEHDSGEEDVEQGGTVPGSAVTDRGWTASRAASAV